MIDTVMVEFGRIDSMVYSAGVAIHGAVAELSNTTNYSRYNGRYPLNRLKGLSACLAMAGFLLLTKKPGL